LRPDELVPLCGAAFEVASIAPGSGGQGGAVLVRPAPGSAPEPAGAVCVPEGGKLRMGGRDVSAATEFAVTAWQPDPGSPVGVEAEAYPAQLERQDTPASQVRSFTLRQGDSAEFGRFRAKVVALH